MGKRASPNCRKFHPKLKSPDLFPEKYKSERMEFSTSDLYIYTHLLYAPFTSFQSKQKNQQFFFFFCKTILALDGGGLRFDSFAIGCAQRAASYGCHLELLLGSAAWFQLPGKGLIRGGLGSFGLGRDPDSSPPSWDEFLLPNDLPTSQVQGILV